MNKITLLRNINRQLKYTALEQYRGLEISLQIANTDSIVITIQNVFSELGLEIASINKDNISGTIAKYGIVDLEFEVKGDIECDKDKGLQLLKENGWIDKENTEEFAGEEDTFLEDIYEELEEKKNYVKIYACAKNSQKGNWSRTKWYLMQQFSKNRKIDPLPEDEVIMFEIEDACYTNYSGIWLWKYFYM